MKLLLQAPLLFEPDWLGLTAEDFTHRAYAAVFRSMQTARSRRGDDPASGAVWVHEVATAVPHPLLASLVAALAVEPLSLHGPATEHYVQANAAKLRLLTVMRQVSELEVQAPAHQPGREPDHVQPDVLRARGAGGPPQPAARREPARGRLVVTTGGSSGAPGAQARASLRSPRSRCDSASLPRRPGDPRTWTPGTLDELPAATTSLPRRLRRRSSSVLWITPTGCLPVVRRAADSGAWTSPHPWPDRC